MANLRLAEQFATPSLGIMAPDTIGGRGEDAGNTATGTGPFRFESYTAGQQLKVVANERYWAGKPRLRSITFRFTKEGDDPAGLLADGEIDVALQSTATELAVATKAGRAVLSTPAQAVSLLLNATGADEYALLGDEAVRKAVALAVDRQGFTTAAWAGRGKPNETVVPPSVLGASSGLVATPARDLAAARTLLDGAGWIMGPDGVRSKDGKPLVLTLLLGNTQDQDAAIGAVQGQLGSVGIGVKLQQPAGAVPLQLVNQGRFHLYLDARLQDDGNPCSFCRLFTSRPGGLLSISSSVTGGPKADELYDRAFTEPKAEDAGRFAADLLHVVTAERFVIVPLSLVATSWLVAPYLRGFVAAPFAGAQTWQGTWLAV